MSKQSNNRFHVDIDKVAEKANCKNPNQLSKKSGIPQTVLSDAKTGRRGVSKELMIKIFDATGCQPGEYIYIDEK